MRHLALGQAAVARVDGWQTPARDEQQAPSSGLLLRDGSSSPDAYRRRAVYLRLGRGAILALSSAGTTLASCRLAWIGAVVVPDTAGSRGSDAWNAKATYDAAVKVKAATGGIDVTKNVVDGLI
jgi:hypothetical protein